MTLSTLVRSVAPCLLLGACSIARAVDIGWNFGDEDAVFDTGVPSGFTVSPISVGNSYKPNTSFDPVNSSSASNTYAGASGSGNIGNAVASAGSDPVGIPAGATDLTEAAYFEVTFTPSSGFKISISDINFGLRRTGTGPQVFAFRTNLDNFAANVAVSPGTGEFTAGASSVWTYFDDDAASNQIPLPVIEGATDQVVTLRIYTYGGTGNAAANTINCKMDDIVIAVEAKSNEAPKVLTASLSPSSASEAAGSNASILTVSRPAPFTNAVEVNVLGDDATEATASASTVTIPAGQESATLAISTKDDFLIDGDKTVVFTCAAAGFITTSASLTVTDNDTGLPQLIINEVYASGLNDANKDGSAGLETVQAAFDDEFIELVNTGSTDLDIGGYTIWNSQDSEARMTFPAGEILKANSAAVIFGGGAVIPGINPLFGTAKVFKATATARGLFLRDSVALTLKNGVGQEVDFVSLGAFNTNDFSYTRSPDASVIWADHAQVTIGGSDYKFSPGYKITGEPFLLQNVENFVLSLSLGSTNIAETAGAEATDLILSVDIAPSSNLTINLTSSLPAFITVPATASIPAGQTSVTVKVGVVNNSYANLSNAAIITGNLFGTIADVVISVEDDETSAEFATSLFINEVNCDGNTTAANLEFIELFTGSSGEKMLNNYFLVLFNGNDKGTATRPAFKNYRAAIDLAGYKTNAQGFFVIDSSFVVDRSAGTTIGTSWLQNGLDGIALYQKGTETSPSMFSSASASTIPPIPTNLVDAVIYAIAASDVIPADTVEPFKTSEQWLADFMTAFTNQGGQKPSIVARELGTTSNPRSVSRRPDATSGYGSNWESTPLTPGGTNGTPTLTGYALWESTHAGIGAADSDPDGDGLANMMEYVLGGNPLTANPGLAPTVTKVGENGLTLSFIAGAEFLAAKDLIIQVEISSDLSLGSWIADVEPVYEGNQVTIAYPSVEGTFPQRFVRLKATKNP